MANAVGSRFEIKEEGFFVIITQSTFRLKYRGIDWGEKPLPGYENDETRLIERFKLSGENRRIGRDLTNDSEREAGKENEKIAERAGFDLFIESVCADIKKKREEKKLAFVMFFLMSHGFEDGKFLLASQGAPNTGSECCSGQHTSSGDCYARDLGTHVIQKVSDAGGVEIPKVFVIQACRGGDAMAVSKGSPDRKVKRDENAASETELFFPNCPNTLVFRAGVEYQLTYVVKSPSLNGSVFIQSFCEAVKELQEECKKYDQMQEKMTKEEKLIEHLQSPGCKEDVTGGWIMNVCQRTSALAANWMVTETTTSKTQQFKQQAHVSSSLSKKLSLVEILRTTSKGN